MKTLAIIIFVCVIPAIYSARPRCPYVVTEFPDGSFTVLQPPCKQK